MKGLYTYNNHQLKKTINNCKVPGQSPLFVRIWSLTPHASCVYIDGCSPGPYSPAT